jgi:hypothetical protein
MLPPVLSYAQDKWGYYNGQNTNQSLLEAKQITYQPSGATSPVLAALGGGQGATRSPSETSMQAGVLQKIIYPTGGYTTFDYQCNKIQEVNYVTNTFTVAAIGANNSSGSLETNIQTYTPTTSMLQNGGNIFTIKISKGNNPYGFVPLPYVQITKVSDGSSIYYNAATESSGVNETVVLPLLPNTQYQIKAVADGNDNMPSSSSPYAIASVSYQAPNVISTTDMGGLRIASIKNYGVDGSLANM